MCLKTLQERKPPFMYSTLPTISNVCLGDRESLPGTFLLSNLDDGQQDWIKVKVC